MSRMEKMRGLLAILQPTQIEIGDDSQKHAGRDGGGHYRLNIMSAQFASKPTLARHRMIYSALGEMGTSKNPYFSRALYLSELCIFRGAYIIKRDIHALHITARTPEEL